MAPTLRAPFLAVSVTKGRICPLRITGRFLPMKHSYLLLAALLAPAGLFAQQQPDFSAFQASLNQAKTTADIEVLDRARRNKDSLAAQPLVERALIALRR